LRCEARDLVADALLARARQLSPSNPIANL
jgi:hypothetical protein